MPYDRKKNGKKTGQWYSDIRVRDACGKPTGERVRVLLAGARTKHDAKEAERKLAQSLQNPEAERPKDLTFREFTREHYRPHAEQNRKNFSYVRTILNRLEEFFGDTPLKEISMLSVERYKRLRATQRTERGTMPKNSSINVEVFGILSSVMQMAHDGNLIPRNPCREVSELSEEPGECPRLSSDAEAGLLEACREGPAYLAPLVTFALGTGMRREEMLKLRWKDVDFSRGLLFVQKPKWDKDPRRTKGLPFGKRVREVLETLPRRSEFVFTTDRGRDVPGTSFYLAFQEACERVSLRFKPHWLRHEFGSRLGDRGVSPYKIARLMGHSNLKMSMRYVHARAEDLQEAVEGLWGENGHPAVTRGKEEERRRA
jgi:integrase